MNGGWRGAHIPASRVADVGTTRFGPAGVDKKLFLADDMFLVALDEWIGRHRIAPGPLSLGIAGGMLAELLLDNAITLVNGKPRPTDAPPSSGVTHMIRDRIAAEPHHDVRTWLLYIAKTATDDVAERLTLAGWIQALTHGGRIRKTTVLYKASTKVIAPEIAWRALRLSTALGASGPAESRGVQTWLDAVLVVLCHAIGLTGFLLRDGGPECKTYIDEIHISLSQHLPAVHEVATAVGELVGTATFTHT